MEINLLHVPESGGIIQNASGVARRVCDSVRLGHGDRRRQTGALERCSSGGDQLLQLGLSDVSPRQARSRWTSD